MALGKKTGGRQKGTPNKRSIEYREQMEALMEKHGWDLREALIAQAMGTDETMFAGLEPQEKAPLMSQARRTIQEYAYPRLKAIEHEVVEPVRVVITDESDQELLD